METKYYGVLTPDAVGTMMKEIVRRMIEDVRNHLYSFEVRTKAASDGSMTEVVTNIDVDAQAICVEYLRERFPGFGIVAEECGLHLECSEESLNGMYFTIDPIDGTKAFVRQQSHGIGTMISLVQGKNIIAAYVGDIMTREIYGYRPESNKVHRISEYGKGRVLEIDRARPLADQYLLLRKRPEQYSRLTKYLIQQSVKTGLFADYEITGGSIGISTARLWKAEIGGTLLIAGEDKPWDICPVLGLCQKLGFVCLAPNETKTGFVIYNQDPSPKSVARDDVLIIHRSRINEFTAWQATYLNG